MTMRIDPEVEDIKEELSDDEQVPSPPMTMDEIIAAKMAQIASLTGDLKKKNICVCKNCGKTYKRKGNYNKHIAECKPAPVVLPPVVEEKPLKLAVFKEKREVNEFNKHKVDYIRRQVHFCKDKRRQAIYKNALNMFDMDSYWKIHRV